MRNQMRRALSRAVMLFVVLAGGTAAAQNSTPPVVADPLALLPASDVVMVIDHTRLWTEAIPRLFGPHSAPLAKVQAEMDGFKAKTGIDIRSISRIAVSTSFLTPDNLATGKMEKKDLALVIILQGDFDSTKFLDFMRREEKDKVREEKYGGQTLYYVEDGPEKGRARLDTERPTLVLLDANTIALGDLTQVRATVDAQQGKGQLSPELLSLLKRDSKALISLAGNVPPSLAASLKPKPQPNESEIDKTFNKFFEAVASIRQVQLSLGMTETGVSSWLGARLGSAEQAQSVVDMMLGVRQQYGVFIEDKVARDLINDMQITVQGDEVQMRSEIPQAIFTAMIEDATKSKPKQAANATAAPARTTVKPAAPAQKKKRRTTRRKKS